MDRERIDEIKSVILAWSREWSEPNPQDIMLVETTGDRGMREIYGEGVGSTPAARYLATLTGTFRFGDVEGGSAPRIGVWAALFIDPVEMRVAGHTVRPPDWIPKHSLENLGRVQRITIQEGEAPGLG